MVALGPALPISRRSRMGVPVGVRANLSLALSVGGFDVVHGFEPGLPSLSYLALRDTAALSVATFFSPDRLAYPLGKAQRDRLLARVDALIATTPAVADAARLRFPGDFRILSQGVDTSLFRPARKTKRIVVEWDRDRAPVRARRDPRSRRAARLGADPAPPPAALGPADDSQRASATASTSARRSTPPRRAAVLAPARVFVPAPDGSQGLRLEATACGAEVHGDGSGPEKVVGYRRGRRRARPPLPPPGHAAPDRRRRACPRRPRLDHLRPAHAHVVVARLLHRGRRTARLRRGAGARRDRDHRPQRVRRRPRGGREGSRSEPRRHPGRGDQDRRPGRGDRALPAGGDPARHVLRRHPGRDPGPGRARLPPPPLRPPPRDPRPGDAPPPPGRDRRVRGLQRTPPVRDLQRRGAALRPQVQPDHGRRLRRARAPRGRHRAR